MYCLKKCFRKIVDLSNHQPPFYQAIQKTSDDFRFQVGQSLIANFFDAHVLISGVL